MATAKTVFGSISRVVDGISHYMGLISGLMTLSVALMTGYEIFMRFVLNSPTIWVFDVTSYLFVGSCYIGLSFTEALQGHVKVDLFTLLMSTRTQRVLEVITGIIGIAFLIFFLWATIWLVQSSFATNEHSGTLLNAPLGPVQLTIPIGILALILQHAVNLIRGSGVSDTSISHEIMGDTAPFTG